MSIGWDVDNSTDMKFSNKNLTAIKDSNGGYSGVLSNKGIVAGRYYWEIYIDECNSECYYSSDLLVGVCSKNQKTRGFSGRAGFTDVMMIYDFGSKIKSNEYEPYGTNFKTGDTVGILLDMVKKNIQFTINGVNQGIAYNNIDSKVWYPCVFAYHNFKWTANFGDTPFKYSIPDGYNVLATRYVIQQLNFFYTIKSEFYNENELDTNLIQLNNDTSLLDKFKWCSSLSYIDTKKIDTSVSYNIIKQ